MLLVLIPPLKAEQEEGCCIEGTFLPGTPIAIFLNKLSFPKERQKADHSFVSTDLEGLTGPTWVLYHYPCPDGVFAALAAFLYHRAVNKEVRFVPNTVYSPRRYIAPKFSCEGTFAPLKRPHSQS